MSGINRIFQHTCRRTTITSIKINLWAVIIKSSKELAEPTGIKIIGYKCVCKEVGTIYTIKNIFGGIPMNPQFTIGSHRIKIYFPKHKLDTECNKHDHKDRDVTYEMKFI